MLGLEGLRKVPDKIVRIELTMLQDLIQMTIEMMDNPVAAVLNFPGGKYPNLIEKVVN